MGATPWRWHSARHNLTSANLLSGSAFCEWFPLGPQRGTPVRVGDGRVARWSRSARTLSRVWPWEVAWLSATENGTGWDGRSSCWPPGWGRM